MHELHDEDKEALADILYKDVYNPCLMCTIPCTPECSKAARKIIEQQVDDKDSDDLVQDTWLQRF